MEFKIAPFIKLGDYLRQNSVPKEITEQAEQENHFFTPSNIERAVAAIVRYMLNEKELNNWIKPYSNYTKKYNSVAIIMAGNIPLVGFLDMMVGSVCDLKTFIKPSSKDRILMNWIVSLLQEFGCTNIYQYTPEAEVECVIATGSNNANRYFELQFGHLPSLTRTSRSSIAILTGNESTEEIENLWHDLFDYFGLGCRNVSHLLVSQNYDIQRLCDILSKQKIENQHFLNAYRQNNAVKTMTAEPFFDGTYFIATISSSLTPPIGEITISRDNEAVLQENSDKIQCIVGKNHIPFGQSQSPTLNDWADNVNTFEFLLSND